MLVITIVAVTHLFITILFSERYYNDGGKLPLRFLLTKLMQKSSHITTLSNA
ncbi:hypothetical protein A6A12_0727 [Vibrio anguillarum]|nr:hypothetical protein A6A12_0727 [Vibrio anguillarum]